MQKSIIHDKVCFLKYFSTVSSTSKTGCAMSVNNKARTPLFILDLNWYVCRLHTYKQVQAIVC
jgi:hypothetical protein